MKDAALCLMLFSTVTAPSCLVRVGVVSGLGVVIQDESTDLGDFPVVPD